MAITQAVCNSFKQELLQGLHDLDGHTLKLALYTSSATLGPTTTAFSTTNESSGTNYSSGGATISNVAVSLSGTVAFVDFDDVSFSSATISDAAGGYAAEPVTEYPSSSRMLFCSSKELS